MRRASVFHCLITLFGVADAPCGTGLRSPAAGLSAAPANTTTPMIETGTLYPPVASCNNPVIRGAASAETGTGELMKTMTPGSRRAWRSGKVRSRFRNMDATRMALAAPAATLGFVPSVVGLDPDDIRRLARDHDPWWLGVVADAIVLAGPRPDELATRLRGGAVAA